MSYILKYEYVERQGIRRLGGAARYGRTRVSSFRLSSEGRSPLLPTGGRAIAMSIVLQIVAVQEWPRSFRLTGPDGGRRIFAAKTAWPSKPQLNQRKSGWEKSFGGV